VAIEACRANMASSVARLIGLSRMSVMPAARQRSRSLDSAVAVIARIGRCRSRARSAWASSYPFITGMLMSVNTAT